MKLVLSGCNCSYGFYSLETFCRLQKELGRDTVLLYGKAPQIWIDRDSCSDAVCTIGKLKEQGLHPLYFEAAEYGYNLAYRDVKMKQNSMNYYKRAIELCAQTGIEKLLMGCKPVYFNQLDFMDNQYMESLSQLYDYADDRGVGIVIKCSEQDVENIEKAGIPNRIKKGQGYSLDTYNRKSLIRDLFSEKGKAESVLLKGTAKNIQKDIDELIDIGYTGPAVVYQILGTKTMSSISPKKIPSYLSDMQLQAYVSMH